MCSWPRWNAWRNNYLPAFQRGMDRAIPARAPIRSTGSHAHGPVDAGRFLVLGCTLLVRAEHSGIGICWRRTCWVCSACRKRTRCCYAVCPTMRFSKSAGSRLSPAGQNAILIVEVARRANAKALYFLVLTLKFVADIGLFFAYSRLGFWTYQGGIITKPCKSAQAIRHQRRQPAQISLIR